MNITIHATQLRKSLAEVIERVSLGVRFTVLYRGRRAFQVAPIDDVNTPRGALQSDPLYRAKALGRSTAGRSAASHDAILYG